MGMHCMPSEAVVSNYAGDDLGRRDYDVGVWLKTDTSPSSADQNQQMEPEETKTWYKDMLRET